MIHVPALRWGKPYESLDRDRVVHFDTGDLVAEVSQAVPGMIRRDMRHAQTARDALREIPCAELCGFGHSGMLGHLTVHTDDDYAEWVSQRWPK